MNGQSASKTLVSAREDFVWKLRCMGYTERRIADEFSKPENAHLHKPNKPTITQQAISKIIRRVEARVLARMDSDVERMKKRQTAILERNIEDLRDAFEKSTKSQTFQKQKTANGGAGKSFQQQEIGQKTLIGDHSILRELRETLSDIRKIWGADAPVKTQSEITGAMQIASQDLSALSDEDLQTLLMLQQKLKAANQTPNATPGPTS